MNNSDDTVFVNPDKNILNQAKNLSALEMAYLELGKAYYEGGFEDPLPQLLPIFDKITTLKKQGVAPVHTPLAEETPEAKTPIAENPVAESPVIEKPVELTCPHCGKVLTPNARFCGKCGHPVK